MRFLHHTRHQFIAFAFILLLPVGQTLAKTIYIYDDKGACEECVQETERSLREELSEDYDIARIKAAELMSKDWQSEAALLVIPGGKASPYAELLNGTGNALIRRFVEDGGSYLGLCAGGYYGGAFVEFAKDTSIEVMAKRELAFFPGTVVGPALGTYDYYSESGAQAAFIKWNDNDVSSVNDSTLYYNGGGYFADASNYSDTRVIATYEALEGKPPAIIETSVGNGVAILSGVHFEYNCEVLARISPGMSPSLDELEMKRKKLLRYILVRLGLVN